jgi:thymidylate synthase ThyX
MQASIVTSATVVKHSVTRGGSPIATLALVYPRFVHSEFMTHRAFSRNAMSSRAVPVAKMIAQVRENPAMPIHWGANQPGMQAGGEIEDRYEGVSIWLCAAADAANRAEQLNNLGLHKQVVNRILEPFQWMHTVVTSTEWENFFSLRCHEMAEPNMQALAYCMRDALQQSTPLERDFHMPYFDDIEYIKIDGDVSKACMISAARCARVSYLNHDGTAPDIEKDLALGETLKTSNHASPFEHVAFAAASDVKSRNFTGWTQYREVIGL